MTVAQAVTDQGIFHRRPPSRGGRNNGHASMDAAYRRLPAVGRDVTGTMTSMSGIDLDCTRGDASEQPLLSRRAIMHEAAFSFKISIKSSAPH